MMGRPLPPPIPLTYPPCPICAHYLDTDEGTSWRCDQCGARWPFFIDEQTEGEWTDPDAEQCSATCQPHLHNGKLPQEVRSREYRCLLDKGHEGTHDHHQITLPLVHEWRQEDG